ncbi:helix-turn-helix domain-containing protein [Clostridium beijerinckii]|uniref:AraC-like DNA-binding protein n=1 Tax=Clostridium beijerinckii TaxID=1520 RepID=A0AAE5H994_CLOBE|nr:AraC family transcriptional regulator [Clostridium beijerinckii]NSB16833.1 AraC-like DNA-binding protein [Clostridium beijerinckii]OOM25370.1 transposon Tn10 TetD protein [Clostridium beijerinckii]
MRKITNKYLSEDDNHKQIVGNNFEIYEKHGVPMTVDTYHYHDFYEVVFILDGECSMLVNDSTYYLKRGDFLLISSGIMHKYNYNDTIHTNSKRLILWISRPYLDSLSDSSLKLYSCFEYSQNTNNFAYHFPSYYNDMLQYSLIKISTFNFDDKQDFKGKDLFDKANLTIFFTCLCNLCQKNIYNLLSNNHHRLIDQVSYFIDEHITDEILIDDLVSYLNISKYHFIRKFKYLTGITVHYYIINKKMICACEDIKNTNRTFSYISSHYGFGNYSSFLRNFIKINGISPAQYRKISANLYPKISSP